MIAAAGFDGVSTHWTDRAAVARLAGAAEAVTA